MPQSAPDPLVETWQIHDRINRYLLDAIAEADLSLQLSPKLRSIYKLFAHIHNVRLMWIKPAAADLLEGLDQLDSDHGPKADLESALEASGNAIATLVSRAVASGGKVKGFKPHVTAFVGYLISHESHHRGQIGWTLKSAGKPLPQKVAYGLWEWGVR